MKNHSEYPDFVTRFYDAIYSRIRSGIDTTFLLERKSVLDKGFRSSYQQVMKINDRPKLMEAFQAIMMAFIWKDDVMWEEFHWLMEETSRK
jgi:hypothetical protein